MFLRAAILREASLCDGGGDAAGRNFEIVSHLLFYNYQKTLGLIVPFGYCVKNLTLFQ